VLDRLQDAAAHNRVVWGDEEPLNPGIDGALSQESMVRSAIGVRSRTRAATDLPAVWGPNSSRNSQCVKADDMLDGASLYPGRFQADRRAHRVTNQDGAVRDSLRHDLGDVGGVATDPVGTEEMTSRAAPGQVDGKDNRARLPGIERAASTVSDLRRFHGRARTAAVPSRRRRKSCSG
jgi:hypothetical protein